MSLIRFGVFELDRAQGVLRKDGRRVHLAAQSFKVLVALVERAGDVVTREQLRATLWGASTFVEFDRSLNFCVSTVRAALGDNARHPRFIETVPTRGYRFLADVHVIEPAGTAHPTRPSSSRSPRWTGLAAAVLLLCLQGPATVPAHTRETARPAALAAFEQGLRAFNDGSAGRERSLDHFAAAIRLDARFAEAYYAMADTYLRLDRRVDVPSMSWRRVRELAATALALEEMPATHLLIASIAAEHDWAWREAETHLQRAIALAPTSDVALAAYARFLSAEGRDPEAIAVIQRAQATSDCELLSLEAAHVFLFARRYSEALDAVDKAEDEGAPDGVRAEVWSGRLEEMRQFVLAAADGWRDRTARRFFAQRAAALQRAAVAGEASPTRVATLFAAAGQTTDALAWLERAAIDRDAELVHALRHPAFDAIRGSRPFASIERVVRADLVNRSN